MKQHRSFSFFLPLLFLSLVEIANAQRFGLSGGASVNPITSLRVSGIMELDMGNWLSIQPEIAYFRKGHPSLIDRLSEIQSDFGYGALDMISCPILFKLKMEREDFAAYLLAGPELSFGYAALAVYVLEDGAYQREHIPINRYAVKHWDLGVTIGLGLEKHIRQEQRIFMDFRYYLGLNNINIDQRSVLYLEAFYFNFGMLIPFHLKHHQK
ncbi:MAG: outer membrane beta-barrel protein [Saprospiraceae bacterium]